MTKSETSPPSNRHVIIAGAGIAGLTAAIALAQRGFDVSLCERAPVLSEVGAGLQLSPNATRLLRKLGVLDAVLKTATATRSIDLLSARSGRTLLSLPASSADAGGDAPFLAVHRADLQNALMSLAERTRGVALRRGLTFENVWQTPDGMEARFDCNGEPVIISGGALIGADGVWSQVGDLVPGANPARHSGYMAWRATVPANAGLPDPLQRLCAEQRVGAFLSPGAHLVAYPLRHGSTLNLVLITPGTDTVRGWDNPVDLAVLSDALGQFSPGLGAFLSAIPAWRSWPLNGRAPDGAWTSGRIALIGDAAHAMTPFAAQGACMAIEDAVVISDALAANPGDVAQAFAAYETARRPRVARVIARGKFNRFAYHVSGPATLARNAVFALRGAALMRELDWLYGFDASA